MDRQRGRGNTVAEANAKKNNTVVILPERTVHGAHRDGGRVLHGAHRAGGRTIETPTEKQRRLSLRQYEK